MNLKEMNNLSVKDILPYLTGPGVSAGIEVHDCMESTNTAAREIAMSGGRHGTVVVADCQIAGKGRYGRGFFSPRGHGIYMSFIFENAVQSRISTPTMITVVAAVSVCEAIEAATGKTPQIKWVNDIFLDGKKICGILCETLSRPGSVADIKGGNNQGIEVFPCVIVGIGVNFSTPETGYPDEIAETAGSIFGKNEPAITRNRLAAEIINRMFNAINKTGRPAVLAEYKKRLMMLGEKVVVTGIHETYEATAVDIDDTGRLIIKKENGEIQTLASGEIGIRQVV